MYTQIGFKTHANSLPNKQNQHHEEETKETNRKILDGGDYGQVYWIVIVQIVHLPTDRYTMTQ